MNCPPDTVNPAPKSSPTSHQAHPAQRDVADVPRVYPRLNARTQCFGRLLCGRWSRLLQDMHMPSDLSGLAVATYDPKRCDGNVRAAVGAACTQIKLAVRDQEHRR